MCELKALASSDQKIRKQLETLEAYVIIVIYKKR